MKNWLFKKINLSLTSEVIFNISLLMLAAILLIGFTLSKINEKNLLQGKIKNGEGVAKDFQAIVDFLSKDKNDFSFVHPLFKKEVQEFISIYLKERRFYELVVVDQDLNVVASKNQGLLDKRYSNDLMKNAISSGRLNTEIESTGGFLTNEYKKIILYSPLWFKGKVIGGIQIDIPIGDVMIPLVESQKILIVSILLDAIVLIIFGSFLMSRILVRPLKDLVQLTQKISLGDFSQKIEVTSRNEIGQLISSFNRMVERLEENQNGLERYVKSLESMNKQLQQAQEELIRTEKLASVGRLAAGVAHEIGNPLGAIFGYTEILEKGDIQEEEAKDYLKRIGKEIERINRIVRQLLDFARPSKFEIFDVEINKVIENTLSLIFYQKNFKNIEPFLELQQNLPMIKGDESQLSQVLMNIILNAVDAMPNGGSLKIQTETFPEPLQPPYARRHKSDSVEINSPPLTKPSPWSTSLTKFTKGENWVRIGISDTGMGIRKEDIGKIFDPFYTTKDPNKGTGLGLSISLKIVESMGGEIRVESELGRGTTFEIYFPAAPHGRI